MWLNGGLILSAVRGGTRSMHLSLSSMCEQEHDELHETGIPNYVSLFCNTYSEVKGPLFDEVNHRVCA